MPSRSAIWFATVTKGFGSGQDCAPHPSQSLLLMRIGGKRKRADRKRLPLKDLWTREPITADESIVNHRKRREPTGPDRPDAPPTRRRDCPSYTSLKQISF